MNADKSLRVFNRRQFLQSALVSVTAASTASLSSGVQAAVTREVRDEFGGLKIGITSYTFREFNLEQAIAMTKQAGVKYISIKDMHLPMKSTLEQRQEAKRKIEAAGLVLMGGGVIYLKNNPEELKAAFDYVKEAGMPTMVCNPEPEALNSVEKLAKEYDVRIAIHNHGPGDKRYPSPVDVWRMVKDRDSRMGLCMDVGHTVRIGEDPVAAIEQCAKRLYDFHMKDVTAATAQGKETEVGKGVIDIVGVVRELLRIRFPYHVALEYEKNGKNPMPGVLESYAYLRGVIAALV